MVGSAVHPAPAWDQLRAGGAFTFSFERGPSKVLMPYHWGAPTRMRPSLYRKPSESVFESASESASEFPPRPESTTAQPAPPPSPRLASRGAAGVAATRTGRLGPALRVGRRARAGRPVRVGGERLRGGWIRRIIRLGYEHETWRVARVRSARSDGPCPRPALMLRGSGGGGGGGGGGDDGELTFLIAHMIPRSRQHAPRIFSPPRVFRMVRPSDWGFAARRRGLAAPGRRARKQPPGGKLETTNHFETTSGQAPAHGRRFQRRPPRRAARAEPSRAGRRGRR